MCHSVAHLLRRVYKNSPSSLEGLSRAPDGNRTRTDISVHGIFLLLLLLHKPASSVMLSRCSLDYFLTVRRCVATYAFRPSLYSLYAIYQPEDEFSKPSPKPAFLQARFLFVRGVLLSRFPLRHSFRASEKDTPLKSRVSTYSTTRAIRVQR